MKKILLLTGIILFLFSCKSDKKQLSSPKSKIESLEPNKIVTQNKKSIIEDKKSKVAVDDNNEISLKGGYSISYSTDNEDQYLLYKKGISIIDTLNSCSIGLPIKNLGYIICDFNDTFIIGQSYGSGNPDIIQLYEKKTRKKLIKDYSAIIDIDTTNQILLYSENDVPNSEDKMILLDIKKRNKKSYEFPKEVFGEPEILNRIHFINSNDQSFIIEYEFNDYNNKNQKKYIR
ncbi:hypothetical protein [Flavobacterium limi]|uniref:Uncharacterized protein n=1 Tax=Flavobacterium limi TaxID=2045105 RepID=A0ABQ1URI0_9FLAO|nr:hypothetical protein [Flavobacterium limi]GGF25440.1 hypothetical protein GCM10011518_38480 [Flavobacterium limi]